MDLIKKAVVEHGVDARGAWGRTALIEAIVLYNPIEEVVDWLISQGADPAIPDNFGKCALDYAPEEMQPKLRAAQNRILVSKRIAVIRSTKAAAEEDEADERYKENPKYGSW